MGKHLISFFKARKLLLNSLYTLEEIEVPVKESLFYVLARDIHSPIDLPVFTNSAMDGYALCYKKFKKGDRFRVIGEIKAGDYKGIKLKEGEAFRVFTGSPLPENTTSVVMQEFVEREGDYIIVKKGLKKGENIRNKGEEVKRGKLVLKKGEVLNPNSIGFLSMLGIEKVKVIRRPKVFIVVTGSELIKPGEKLLPGKIYDSNSFSLYSSLRSLNISDIEIRYSGDNFDEIRNNFYEGFLSYDLILFSGGISVGDYDLVRELFKSEGVERVFYKVAQKPGKPLFFGKKGKSLIFGLPGNPFAVLFCFYEYIYPAVRRMSGFKDIFLPEKKLTLLKDIRKKNDRAYFLKGKIYGDKVLPLKYQESHMLSSLAKGDCLIFAPKNKTLIKKGEKVRVHLLPKVL
ncbi:MAG: molybdopterin molybdotransferase MoeA [Candidatus Omnitrophica bacterium]|nr:molybdopterin molybdotransferase MoeA [Candidatus Omnitrophota bacterium]